MCIVKPVTWMLAVVMVVVARPTGAGPLPCGVGWGDCYAPGGTAGCEHVICCFAVCEVDEFCCIAAWDALCVELALELCPGGACAADLDGSGAVDGTDLGVLLGAWGARGAADLDGSGSIDGADLGLLLAAWGACATGCGDASLGCYAFHVDPGCEDEACCETVCELDFYCCDAAWDYVCVYAAGAMCLNWGAAGGDCFEANGTPGCQLLGCGATVCAAMPGCCAVAWDVACAALADRVCTWCDIGAGDCYEPNGTPGCGGTAQHEPNPASCCGKVCAEDPFCCEVEWDVTCANEAAYLCGVP